MGNSRRLPRFSPTLVLLVIVVVAVLACGPSRPVGVYPVVQQPSPVPLFDFFLPITATPWPTFTPVPPVSPSPYSSSGVPPTPIPAVRPVAPTVTPVAGPRTVLDVQLPTTVPTLTPVPTATPVLDLVESVVLEPVDTPVSATSSPTAAPLPRYGKLPGLEVYFEDHRFFVAQSDRLDPVYAGTCEGLPLLDRVPRDAPFLFWAICFDATGMDGQEFEYSPVVRWSYVGQEFVDGQLITGWKLFSTNVHRSITGPVAWMLTGIGDHLWSPGEWRIELLDEDGEEVIHSWYFEVFSPIALEAR